MAGRHEASEQELEATARAKAPEFGPGEEEAFALALTVLNETGLQYVAGGAYAMHVYTGIWRDTKDLDVFLKPEDLQTALDALSGAGFQTEVELAHWLAKARRPPHFVDLIFGASNGLLRIDDAWFDSSQPAEIAGVQTRLIALEELLASKAYIAVRHRFDGADVAHMIRGAEGKLDWERVLVRLGPDRELLLWHLILFGFVYPGHAEYLPQQLIEQLFEQVRDRWSAPTNPAAFRGTLLDPFSFTVDIEDWSYQDRRNPSPLVGDDGRVV